MPIKAAFGFERRLNGLAVGSVLIFFSLAFVALADLGTRLSSIVRGPRLATAAEILASVKRGDSHEWFELTEQPEPVLTRRFQMRVKGETRTVEFHLMRAQSAPGLPISTMKANPTAPFDVWTCNHAALLDDYGRGVSAAIKQANPPMAEPFMLCEAENTRAVTRVVTAFVSILFIIIAAVVALVLPSRLKRLYEGLRR
jgi:hypothetical protein